MASQFKNFILESASRIAMPIGVYAGLEITGATVKDAVTNAKAQTEAVLVLHERFNTQVLLTAMDLSVEAEAFGSEVRLSTDEIPTVIGHLVTTENEIDRLACPTAGYRRTAVYLETARELVRLSNGIPVLGGVIGPFSLVGRLFGVSEALELSLTDPELLEKLLSLVTCFLMEYVNAFREQGVAGVIMAEPAAGLLAPRGLGRFSSQFIRQIANETQNDHFSLILHNCGAKIVHLPYILEAGAEMFHFGAPMDIDKALAQVTEDVILAGNLDPTSVFYSSMPDDVAMHTQSLLDRTTNFRNFIISSGCDIPPGTSLKNLETFYNTVNFSIK
jgi:uroporphyrinogen decarboxylase